ncbi:conserved hypothetical protein [Candidatus Caldarchaeum subterraneum]|uniref:DUF87 domain-containing protein n=1 Tax=Caldiarchaeum subterraneum TaxID=311458 RepID=E6N8M0_CALS0|nr:conserved hypothetical protein [Candidatus Caldarchaeum subterraneum]BAJ51344.1 conserved hypothetical protein [Candidatus Caldarchaeum subterraneum]
MNPEELLGKRTLIIGEAGSGKTSLLAQVLQNLLTKLGPCSITVIDLAPPRIMDVGGPLTEHMRVDGLHYKRPPNIYAPRLMACNAEELKKYVHSNLETAKRLFNEFIQNPTPVLAVNDVTIFLHGAEAAELLAYVEKASTFIATAYYGTRLAEDFGTGLTESEKRRVEELSKHVNIVINLNSSR